MKEDSLKHTMKQVAGDYVNVCFITAYQGARPKEENEAANEELAKDIRRLGYGFTKTVGGFQYGDGSIGHEPGFKVAIKNPNPEKFVEEMMALLRVCSGHSRNRDLIETLNCGGRSLHGRGVRAARSTGLRRCPISTRRRLSS